MTRRRLPNRRSHESRDLIFDGRRFSLGVGFDDTGAPAEVFVSAPRAGSGYAALARDAGILLSLALQSGADPATIRHALTREENGEAASLLGAIADEIGGQDA
ncbi:hypothetical protein [Methylocystis sp.]|uniref:TSCPD domain-containing protein n=1 Tax=Methylocystis sp. TaxID=1911079 RepID=UPI003D1385BB